MSKVNDISIKEPTPEETIEWWIWVDSIQEQNDKNQKHPFLVGGETHQNQTKKFVCLTGIGREGGNDSRQISISSDKDLLIPVFVASYSNAELPGKNLDELLQQAVKETKNPQRLDLSIDGNKIQPYFVEAGPFNIYQPNICIADPTKVTPGDYPTMSAGHWCKIALPKRSEPYKIRFGGANTIDIGNGPLNFDTDVTYEVTVS